MAKNKNIIINLFYLLLAFGIAWTEPVIACDRCVIDRAFTQVGVRESTGNNDGEVVEQYLKTVGLKKGQPWCAAFISDVMHWCGVSNPMSGYSPLWFQKNIIYKKNNPLLNDVDKICPADVFGIYFNNLARIAHVGFVVVREGSYIRTIEGNTNDGLSREGDGVYSKRRLVNQVYAVSRWAKNYDLK